MLPIDPDEAACGSDIMRAALATVEKFGAATPQDREAMEQAHDADALATLPADDSLDDPDAAPDSRTRSPR